MRRVFTCDKCDTTVVVNSRYTSGYGIDSQDNKVCYDCCAKQDIETMKHDGKITLYLTTGKNGAKYQVSNWPGSLSFHVAMSSEGNHNIARTRTDVWFKGPDGFIWHGTQYGNFSELTYCKRTKKTNWNQL